MSQRHPSRWTWPVAALALAALLASPIAHAGLFDDDEARRAILDLRQKLEQTNEMHRARQAEQMSQLSTKLGTQIDQLQRGLLDLNNQLEAMRAENAKLRGQIEPLARDLSEAQRGQRDLQQLVEERLAKLEPAKVTVDEKDFQVAPDEKRLYDEAMMSLRKGDFDKATLGLTAFMSRYPGSGYGESAQFWLGNAQYGRRDYAAAITSFRALVTAAPSSPRAPEALLSLANCQVELKDPKGARKTLEELIRTYPRSEAAAAGKDRLASIK